MAPNLRISVVDFACNPEPPCITTNLHFYIISSRNRQYIVYQPGNIARNKTGRCDLSGGGNYYRILISNLNGIPDQPITLKNMHGRVVVENDSLYGISIMNTSCFCMEGNDCDSIVYGIVKLKVTGGAGLSFDQFSSCVSASYIEIANTALSGIIAKTDPNCSFLSTLDKFTMYNTSIHNNYLHDIGMEGLYLGNSFYNGFMIHCNDTDTLVYPHLMNGLQVFDNLIE